MFKVKKSLESFHKNNKWIAIVAGIVYFVYAIFNLGIVKLQDTLLNSSDFMPNDNMPDFIGTIHQNIKLMMPYLALIGLCFIVFGILYKKLKPSRLPICFIIIFACSLWATFHIIFGIQQISLIYDDINSIMPEEGLELVDNLSQMSKYMSIMGFFMSIVYLLGPIVILTIRIKLNDEEV